MRLHSRHVTHIYSLSVVYLIMEQLNVREPKRRVGSRAQEIKTNNENQSWVDVQMRSDSDSE